MKRLILILALTVTAACGGGARHVAVVADQTAYETFSDLHALEQTALCGLPSCAASAAVEHEQGWTLAKSQAFNGKLLPGVRAGQQFNQLLAGWKPGTPVPQAVTDGVGALGAALAAVVADFPPGTTKDKILANIGRAQGLFLNAFQIILAVKGA